jgi:hypothetical protein
MAWSARDFRFHDQAGLGQERQELAVRRSEGLDAVVVVSIASVEIFICSNNKVDSSQLLSLLPLVAEC